MKTIHRSLAAPVLTMLLAGIAACGGDAQAPAAKDPGCDPATASGELAHLSCTLKKPVNTDGFTPDELDTPVPALEISADDAEKAARTYTGACTGIWYGCSRVVAEGWEYTVCGSSLYTFMTFDGPYHNLTGYGIGYCWF